MIATTLNRRVMRNTPNIEKLQRVLARERNSVRTQLDALWLQSQGLADEINSAIQTGGSAERQHTELAVLLRRSCQLAELGAAIDLERSEVTSIDHGRGGKRWRPTVAEPF